MIPPTHAAALSLSAELAHRVEAFELALDLHPEADLATFLPPPAHPLHLAVLGELIRIDLERAWDRGARKRVADYASRFPALLSNGAVLGAVAFEEYRQRVRTGESVNPDEYRHRFAVDTAEWGDFGPESTGAVPAVEGDVAATNVITPRRPADLLQTAAVPVQPPTQDRLAPPKKASDRAKMISEAEALAHMQAATESLPRVGTEFVGFLLTEELGRGAFGRVYLARQGDLAGRPVALKVASGLAGESNTLAQLQHTNIVPIYSYHSAGPFQAVCMPYLGGTTLAQVVRSISKLPGVPSSGKELRSTLQRGKLDTQVSGTPSDPASVGSQPSSAVSDPTAAVPVPSSDAEGWARFEGLPFADAVLALGGQLADGLSHAHRRGILHRDLKPANVLLTDDGRPMLLDFNLAEDTKLRGSAERALIGGTLPYMSPEQLHAFRASSGQLDARSDLYSLGVILFELLTGKHPFPVRKGYPRDTVPLMIADRAQAPSPRAYNPSVAPGLDAIVRKCLASAPARRYQTADELREDIDLHLASRRLKHAPNPSRAELVRKWARRHPRLASSTTVGAVAAVLLLATAGAGVYARERTRDVEARGRFAEHQVAFRDAQTFLDDRTRSSARLDESGEKLRSVLRGYGVSEADASDGWQSAPALRYLSEPDRARVFGDVGEVFFLLSQVALLKSQGASDAAERAAHLADAARWTERAERYGESRLPRAIREQKAALAEARGDHGEAARSRAAADLVPPTARDLYLTGSDHTRAGRAAAGLPHLKKATELDPESYSAWFHRGVAHLMLEQDELATMCFTACIALRPDFAPAWFNRGFAFLRMRLFPDARSDFDKAVAIEPKMAEAYFVRAELREATGDHAGAAGDYTKALETGAAPARAYFKRAVAKESTGDHAGAKADRAAGFKTPATDELSWVARAENRWQDDPKGALTDVDEALKLNPWSIHALQMKAAILSEGLKRPDAALAVLDRAVELHPEAAAVRAGRGVLLARAGKRDAALRDAQDALRRDTRSPNVYQVGCIYALTAKTHPDDTREALKLLWDGLKNGFALDIVDSDTDLDAIRNNQSFKDLVKDARELDVLRRKAK